jgi:tripartite-type tricarboxylate transporter receptor subunit TctC
MAPALHVSVPLVDGGRVKMWAHRVLVLACVGAIVGPLPKFFGAAVSAEVSALDTHISFIVGMPPGGSVDAYARLVQRHFPHYLPNNPTIVVQNRPGAGSLLSVMTIANGRPSDGLMIGTFSSSLIPNAIADPQRFPIDFRHFRFIGKVGEDYRVCYLRSTSGIHNLKELAERGRVTFAATAPGTSGNLNLAILQDLFKIPLKPVLGYEGSAAKRLAFDRGEVDGDCGGIESIPSDWLTNGKLNLLVRFLPDLQAPVDATVPFGGDLTDSSDRQLYDFLTTPEKISGMFLVSDRVTQDTVDQLRRAFEAMVVDPDFQTDARHLGLPIAVTSGAALDENIAQLYATPSEILLRAKRLLQE